jgi:hypothetical protein
LSKIRVSLLDRIDLRVEIPAIPYKELREKDAATVETIIQGSWNTFCSIA